LFFSYFKKPDIRFEILSFPDEETFQFLVQNNKNQLFTKGVEDLKWIFQHRWISEMNRETASKYPFSATSESFKYETVKVWQNSMLKSVFIFSVREGNLKTLLFQNPPDLNEDIARFIKKYCTAHKIERITIYNKNIASYFLARKFPFLAVKKYGQKIYSSFSIPGAENYKFQDGEGDTIFT
jgi:hypothetical protein